MSDLREAAESLIEEDPEYEAGLEELLARQESAPWSFDEIPFDSGEFGEVVSHGLVTETEGGYRLADPSAVEAALNGTDGEEAAEADVVETAPRQRISRYRERLSQGRLRFTALGMTLLLAGVVRTVFGYTTVFRDNHVVLVGNDPYLIFYWVDHLHDSAYKLTAPGTWASLPAGLWDHDLLGILILWALSAAGGGASAVGTVLAWYPVGAAILVGLLVYQIAVLVSQDARVGIAAVLFYAVTPATVNRTMIGFADTEGFDYLWLMLTLLTFVFLLRQTESVRPSTGWEWAATVGFGVSVAAQILTWRGGPLLLFPVALCLLGVTVSAYRAEQSLVTQVGSLFVGLAVASTLTVGVHLAFGWAQAYRALTPVLLLVGGAVTVGHFRLAREQNVGLWTATAGFGIVGTVAVVALWVGVPPVSAGITEFLQYMSEFTWSSIGETQSIFSADRGTWLGPVFYLGVPFVFGFGALCWATWVSSHRHAPEWLVLAVYGWWFLALTIVQLRFAGYLGLFVSILGGVGFLYFLAALEIAAPVELSTRPSPSRRISSLSVPDRQQILYTIGVLVFVVGFSLLLLPGFHDDLTTEDSTYQTAAFIADHSDATGTEYPETYVFSAWDDNRMYNRVVNGHGHSYHYAQHNYESFIAADQPAQWYERLANRTGYVVTTDRDGFGPATVQTRLQDGYGSATNETAALVHYRALYRSPEGSQTVFSVVPGATVRGTAQPNTTLIAKTTATLAPTGVEISYRQRVQTDTDGSYSFVTPYPGAYELGTEQVTVPEPAVKRGQVVRVDA
jgi:dolichyl-diphosphooligosaccharide--protein glycosyltransferase